MRKSSAPWLAEKRASKDFRPAMVFVWRGLEVVGEQNSNFTICLIIVWWDETNKVPLEIGRWSGHLDLFPPFGSDSLSLRTGQIS